MLVRHCCSWVDYARHSPEQVLESEASSALAVLEKDWRAHRNISARPTRRYNRLHNFVTQRQSKVPTASTACYSMDSAGHDCNVNRPREHGQLETLNRWLCSYDVLCYVVILLHLPASASKVCRQVRPRLAGREDPTALTVASWLTLETCLRAVQCLRLTRQAHGPFEASTTSARNSVDPHC